MISQSSKAEFKISVVVTVYNTAPYLSSAIDSLLNQASPYSQIVIVEDGSTDGSKDILKKYLSLPNVIVVFRKKNGGVGAARNIGVSLITESYFHFFDSDDLLPPNFTSEIRRRLVEQQFPDLLFFSGVNVDYKTLNTLDDGELSRGLDVPICSASTAYLVARSKGHELTVQPVLYVVATKVWRGASLEFNAELHEDEEVFGRLLAAVKTVAILDICLYFRRVRPNSIMTSDSNGGRKCRGLLAAVRSNSLLLKNLNVHDTAVRKIIARRMMLIAGQYFFSCSKFNVAPNYIMVIFSFLHAGVKPPIKMVLSYIFRSV